jgi:hypothetical protein
VTVVEWVRPPPVPVMVKVRVRFWTFDWVVTVSVEVPAFTTDAGENVAVERCGVPVTERLTVPANPVPAVIVKA